MYNNSFVDAEENLNGFVYTIFLILKTFQQEKWWR
jgi:hypothetical protein